MLERAVGVDGWGPGRPGAGPAGAGEVPEAPEAPAAGLGLGAGQQRHLLARHACCCRHSWFRVAPQPPQVLEQRVQQVLVDVAGAGVMNQEAWTKAKP